MMGSLMAELEAREAAAQARAEALRARIAALTEELAVEEELCSRLGITRQTVLEILGGRADLGKAPAAVRVGVGAVTVPAWQAGVTEAVLPVAYRDVLEVLADAGQGLRTKQIAAALGLGGEHRSVEGLRLKLKRLVRRGWLAEPSVGLFVRRTHPAESA